MLKEFIICLLVCIFLVTLIFLKAFAPEDSVKSKANAQSIPRDGQHDFDFNIGTWKTRVSRLLHPLTGSTTWTEYDGISVVREVWKGRANLLELEVDGVEGRIQGLGLRLYNPESHQWSLNWANSQDGTMTTPMIGEFKDGRGEFFDQEKFNGRAILVRNRFIDIKLDFSRFEQAFSIDGGKTWETNWIMTFTRIEN